MERSDKMKNEMKCVEARTILLGRETDRFAQERIISAESHVAHCEECVRYFQYNAQLQELLRQKLRHIGTPPEVRESLFQRITKSRGKKSKIGRLIRLPESWLGRVAILVLLVTGGSIGVYLGFVQHRDHMSSLLPSLLVQDHIELQMREHPFDIQTSDKSQLERWFEKRVDFAVSIPTLPGTELEGGRLCYLLDRRVAFSVFKKDGKFVSAYILDGAGIDLSSIDRVEYRSKQHVCWRSEKGYNAVLWNSNGLIYTLVSSIPMEELEILATNSEPA